MQAEPLCGVPAKEQQKQSWQVHSIRFYQVVGTFIFFTARASSW
jgi:hypothetical protein